MAEPTFLNEDRICFGDTEIVLLKTDNVDQVSRDDILFMFKSIGYIRTYQRIKRELG